VDEFPPAFLDVVQAVDTAGGGIAGDGVVDRPLTEIDRLLQRQVFAPVGIQHAVRVQRAAPDAEVLALEAGTVVVHVVQLRAGFVPPGDHRTHTEPVSAIRAHNVRQKLRRGGDGDSASVAELVQAAFHTEVTLPEHAVRGPAGHRPEQERVDFDDFLDGTGGDVRALRGPRVDRDDDAAVELERQRRRTLVELDLLVLVSRAADRREVGPAVRSRLPFTG